MLLTVYILAYSKSWMLINVLTTYQLISFQKKISKQPIIILLHMWYVLYSIKCWWLTQHPYAFIAKAREYLIYGWNPELKSKYFLMASAKKKCENDLDCNTRWIKMVGSCIHNKNTFVCLFMCMHVSKGLEL